MKDHGLQVGKERTSWGRLVDLEKKVLACCITAFWIEVDKISQKDMSLWSENGMFEPKTQNVQQLIKMTQYKAFQGLR